MKIYYKDSKKGKMMATNDKKEDPLKPVIELLVFGLNDFESNLESQGQQEFLQANIMPIESYFWDQLIALGAKKGKEVDELFVECELPQGWYRKPSGNACRINLFDERNIIRGKIFYDACFWRRAANFELTMNRFNVYEDYDFIHGSMFFVHDSGRNIAIYNSDRIFFGVYKDEKGFYSPLNQLFYPVSFLHCKKREENISFSFVYENVFFDDIKLLDKNEMDYMSREGENCFYMFRSFFGLKKQAEEWLESKNIVLAEQWSEKYDFPVFK